jgi:tetratricopeptide (TPR) repeat protein
MIATLPESAAPPANAAEGERLRALLQRAAQLAGAFESLESLRAVAEGLRLAQRLGDARAEAQALAIATQCHYQRGDYVSAVATGVDACATLHRNDLAGRSHVMLGVAMAFFSVGEFRRAEQAARRAILHASGEHESQQEATARSALAFVLADDGRFDEALAELRRARVRFRALGDAVRVKKATSNAGHTWRKRGIALAAAHDPAGAKRCWRRAQRHYRRALAIGRSRLDDAIILGCLGECALLLGHAARAMIHLRAAEQRTGPRDAPRIVGNIALFRGQAERQLRRWANARRHLKAALELSEALDNDDLAVQARHALAALAEDRGDAPGAREWRDDAHRFQQVRHDALAGFRRQMRPLWDRYLRGSEA